LDGPVTDEVIAEQIAYYRARAPEYDEWFRREGSYDLGPDVKAAWLDEVGVVERALERVAPKGRILELASGTGWWSERLSQYTTDLTCVDAAPEALEIARSRAPRARFVVADLFRWEPEAQFDFVFFSFWLSHVPHTRFEAFWALVDRCLTQHGRAFFIDNLHTPLLELEGGAAFRPYETPDGVVSRRLNDGREYRAVKVHHATEDLAKRLAALGWRTEVHSTGTFLYYGWAHRDREGLS
jgi:demethylmenaquinone methyltransferase/2-methoxy-6-polyprenyl-1,4-benzoquinol methylase